MYVHNEYHWNYIAICATSQTIILHVNWYYEQVVHLTQCSFEMVRTNILRYNVECSVSFLTATDPMKLRTWLHRIGMRTYGSSEYLKKPVRIDLNKTAQRFPNQHEWSARYSSKALCTFAPESKREVSNSQIHVMLRESGTTPCHG